MGYIKDYTEATAFGSGDILLVDNNTVSSSSTRKMGYTNAAYAFANVFSGMGHRSIFRGKYLGTSVTSAQKAAIQDGTFTDLFIGDYWTIGGVNWVIADMDYWYNCGDTAFTKHHLVIVPEKTLYSAVMNTENITTGAYVGSEMYTTNLETAKTTITSAFGDMVLTHREYLPNTVDSSGKASAGAWYDSTVEIMSEIMVYGHKIRSTDTLHTIDKTQLALFALSPKAIFSYGTNRMWYWLRDSVTSATFAVVLGYGYADNNNASGSRGVRPAFAIG